MKFLSFYISEKVFLSLLDFFFFFNLVMAVLGLCCTGSSSKEEGGKLWEVMDMFVA